jgi:UDP-N-acetylmuramoylalanine--D-glutamate ligase
MPVLAEIELAFRLSHSPWLAVTGTNGKTTTTAWIAHMFRTAGRACLLGGNIGQALADRVAGLDNAAWIVAEVSSFQLEETSQFHPRVAVLTNLTPDHLDRYPDMDAYAAAKARIAMNQDAGDWLIMDGDDAPTWARFAGAASRRLRFSENGESGEGVWLQDGIIMYAVDSRRGQLLPAARVSLRGPHNLRNGMAAAAACLCAGLEPAAVAAALENFESVEHRLEPCGEVAGVRFVNDSKGTNVDSVKKALLSFQEPVHLVLGGKDKGGDFSQLAELVQSKVAGLCTLGEAAAKIEGQLRGLKPHFRAATMEEAVRGCFERAQKGEWVVLSPGCASFDMFDNYEHRGRVFKEAVARLGQGVEASRA